jgi:Cof subfamily protein (haloacid dehalogenase superfamily)
VKKKLIALDLDGTLLTNRKVISPRTKEAIRKVREQGHLVVIATGRPPRSSLNYYEELELDTPMVNFNGALVHHAQDEAWGQYHFPLERETALHVIEACRKFQIDNVMVEIKDDYYLARHCTETIQILGDNRPPLGIGNLEELLDHHEHPTSLLIRPNHHLLPQLRAHLSEEHAHLIEHRVWGAPWNVIEVVKQGVNKAEGLKLIAEHFGVDRRDVIAFGDEDNDLEMIEFAGLGVAMGNAIPKLREVANRVTLTNDQDGIAKVLEEELL